MQRGVMIALCRDGDNQNGGRESSNGDAHMRIVHESLAKRGRVRKTAVSRTSPSPVTTNLWEGLLSLPFS